VVSAVSSLIPQWPPAFTSTPPPSACSKVYITYASSVLRSSL
jgi:hypothetical protein